LRVRITENMVYSRTFQPLSDGGGIGLFLTYF